MKKSRSNIFIPFQCNAGSQSFFCSLLFVPSSLFVLLAYSTEMSDSINSANYQASVCNQAYVLSNKEIKACLIDLSCAILGYGFVDRIALDDKALQEVLHSKLHRLVTKLNGNECDLG